MTEPFEDRLGAFLRWQASDTMGTPTARQVADRIAARQTRPAPWRARPVLIATALMIGILAMLAGAAVIGSRPRTPSPLANGGLVTFDGACGLVAQAIGDSQVTHFLGDVPGCPTGRAAGRGAFADVYYPVIAASADGRMVLATRQVFCGGCGSVPTPEALAAQGVYLVDTEDHDSRRLDDCHTERCGFYAAIAPDGRTVAFSSWPYTAARPGAAIQGDVIILDLDRDARTKINGEGVGGLEFSPDGTHLLISSVKASEDYAVVTTTAEVVDVDGLGRRTIATLDGAAQIAWSADGRSLLVASQRSGNESTGRLTPSSIDVATGQVTAAPSVEADPGTAAWSRDGRLAYTVSDASGEGGRLMIIDRIGAAPRQIAGGSTRDQVQGAPTWSPDGRQIAVAGALNVDGFARTGSFAVPVDGGAATWLGPGDSVLAWLPGGPTPSPAAP